MAKIIKLSESDLNRLVKKVLQEDQSESTEYIKTVPAKSFIEDLYSIADKYGKVNITLTFDGKYIVGKESNTRQKYTITIT